MTKINARESLTDGDEFYRRGDLEGAAREWLFATQALERDPGILAAAATRYGKLVAETEFTDTPIGNDKYGMVIGGYDRADADKLWLSAAQSNEPDAAWAWVGLGRLRDPSYLSDDPDPTGAEEAYRRAAASGHPDAGPCALFKLGRLLVETNEREKAAEAFQRGVSSAHPEWASRCATDLENLRRAAPGKSRLTRFFGR